MTEPLRFHLQVSPRSTRVQASAPRAAVQTNPIARTIIAAVPGRQGAQGPPGQGVPVFGEAPTGDRDGINTIFATAVPFQAGTLAVYLNGIREFYISETSTAAFSFEDAPSSSDLITVDYVKG